MSVVTQDGLPVQGARAARLAVKRPDVNTVAFQIAVHSLVRQKKFIIAILLSLIPAAAAGLAMIEENFEAEMAAGSETFTYRWNPLITQLGGAVVLSATIPLMCLLLAGGMIADEAEERTLSYLLVRPVPRTTLYTSRALAVLVVALPLAFLQVLGLWVMRWISYATYAPDGARLLVSDAGATVSAAGVMWMMGPVLLGTSMLATLFFCLVFGCVSVMSTRYHFFVNLGYFGFWEAMLGHVPAGAQKLTAMHHLSSILDHADSSARLIFGTEVTHPAVSIPLLLVIALSFAMVSAVVVRFRDFHVTSAAT